MSKIKNFRISGSACSGIHATDDIQRITRQADQLLNQNLCTSTNIRISNISQQKCSSMLLLVRKLLKLDQGKQVCSEDIQLNCKKTRKHDESKSNILLLLCIFYSCYIGFIFKIVVCSISFLLLVFLHILFIQ